jgi:hydroxyacylglutathione hydrolase
MRRMMLNVTRIPAFADNYLWLLQRDHASNVVAVDPGDSDAVLQVLNENKWSLSAILLTHHHRDHCGGALVLRERFQCPVWGPESEHIAAVDHPLHGEGEINLADLGSVKYWSLPGHTLGHLAYLVDDAVFCGDVLFGAGCGRLFEGSAEQMHHSLTRLARLPDHSLVYCAHEYTEANLRFALSIEPDHPELLARYARIQNGARITVPLQLGEEKRTNPFLRGDDISLQQRVAQKAEIPVNSPLACFTALRCLKDHFQG